MEKVTEGFSSLRERTSGDLLESEEWPILTQRTSQGSGPYTSSVSQFWTSKWGDSECPSPAYRQLLLHTPPHLKSIRHIYPDD